ncbi:hypothetical protein AnigIFM56816_005163 [Aspergillus niger]|nr:hypothetical protein AnigIFM56816_005163 [Aspergillus niger]
MFRYRILLTDLSRRLPPSVQLDAFDSSLAAFPPKEFLPRNIGLHEWDMKTDIPKEFEGAYDIVHVRNVAFVLSDEEIEDILSKLFKLLKLGGYI